jgi:hypothetical protein
VDAAGRWNTPPLDPATAFDVLAGGFAGHQQGTARGVRPGDAEITVVLARASTISGRVVDEEGKPVPAGVGVLARSPWPLEPGQSPPTAIAYTADDGRFRLEVLSERAYAVAAGGGPTAFVAADEKSGVRAGASDLVLATKRGVRVKGRLVDPRGAGVKTNNLTATGLSPPRTLGCWTNVAADDGSFVLPGVPPGEFHLGAHVGGRYVSLGRFSTDSGDLVVVVPDP